MKQNTSNRRLIQVYRWDLKYPLHEHYCASNEKIVGEARDGSIISIWIDREDGTDWRYKEEGIEHPPIKRI